MILYKYLIYAINRHALDVDIYTYIIHISYLPFVYLKIYPCFNRKTASHPGTWRQRASLGKVLQDHRAHRAGHGAGHQAQGLVVQPTKSAGKSGVSPGKTWKNWGEWKEDSPLKWWIQAIKKGIHSKNSMSGLVDSWESSAESMVKFATNRFHLQFWDGWYNIH